jgi:hypothetical protein
VGGPGRHGRSDRRARPGLINPKLYALASGSGYGNDVYDVMTGNNQANPRVPGYMATKGWDPVTGLGTPDAVNLVPALAS